MADPTPTRQRPPNRRPRLRLGLALSVIDLEAWTPRRLAEIAAEAAWAEAAGFDSAWVSDHFFLAREGRRSAGPEPIATLAYLAARTSRIRLGAMVLCNNFRHPGQLARGVATLMDASDGRLVLGLGCGSQPEEHHALGLPYDHRVSRLEESLTVLPGLLRGEPVTHEGRFVRLRDASVSTGGRVPPIWLAAFGPRMLQLTARLSQGWAGNWNGPDPARFQGEVAAVRRALAAAGREGAAFDVVANLLVLPHRGSGAAVAAEALRLLPDGGPVPERVAMGDAARVWSCLERYREAGATYAVLAPGPRQFAAFPGADRDELAAVVARAAAGPDEEEESP